MLHARCVDRKDAGRVFQSWQAKKSLTEENISEAVSEVRLALLEADVNYSVAKTLVKRVKEKAVGEAGDQIGDSGPAVHQNRP